MQINIKTSAANQVIVSNLTQKLPGGAKENIIARIVLGYSLSSGKRFQQNEFNTYDSQGKEYKEYILFDSANRDFYIALICQAYGINKKLNNENEKHITRSCTINNRWCSSRSTRKKHLCRSSIPNSHSSLLYNVQNIKQNLKIHRCIQNTDRRTNNYK